MTIERRKSTRLRTLLGALVSFDQRRATLDCKVRNLSEDGALLIVPESVALPDRFQLEIPHRQAQYTARICWRDSNRIGVAFAPLAAAAPDVVPLDMVRRLKHAELDNVRLKTRIRELTEAG